MRHSRTFESDSYYHRITMLGPSHFTTTSETETWVFRSRDQGRDLDKMNSSALESRDHGLEITTQQTSV